MNYKDPESITDLLEQWQSSDPEVQEHLLLAQAETLFMRLTHPYRAQIASCQARDNRLAVHCYSSVVRRELELHKAELISRINQELGYHILKDIILL